MSNKAAIGIIGMGVMGKSLALNFARKGVTVAVFNRHVPGKEENIAGDFARQHEKEGSILGFDSLTDFFDALERPRKILLMITAGAVDNILEQLIPFLKHEDVIMDGGNSFYKDTERRAKRLAESKIHFLGVGISGGEEGALSGPSLMPGGEEQGYSYVKELLELAAARDKDANPCCSYLGTDGAGHFIKMVHNGIEYAEMQLLAEAYAILKNAYGLSNEQIADFFNNAQSTGSGGYLIEATIGILNYKEDGEYLLDLIADKSEQKGTGSWTVQSAMEIGMPLSTISEAVMARYLSSLKEKREKLDEIYQENKNFKEYTESVEQNLLTALNTARLINHISGFDFIEEVKKEYGWSASLSEVARIWTNGCIIRSELMEKLASVYAEGTNGWDHKWVIQNLKTGSDKLADIIAVGHKNGIALPVMGAAINHYFSITTSRSSANLIQAQRDYFGAHTFQRTDKPAEEYFHSKWGKK